MLPGINTAALIAGWRHTNQRRSRRPDKRVTRYPAMGLAWSIGGRVPFTRHWGVSLISYAVNGTREAAALPLSIPAAPRGNRCCALRSPPACLTAAGSTRLARPFGDSVYSSHPWDSPLRGQRKRCSKLLPAILSLSRFASVRHPWRPDLVIHASVRRFQRGHNPIAVR